MGPKGDTGEVGPRGLRGEPGAPGPPSFLFAGNFQASSEGFFPPNGDRVLRSEPNAQLVVPAGLAQHLLVRLSLEPRSGGRAVATVRRNGRDTALRCRIDDGQTQCSDDGSVEFRAGDLLSISYSPVDVPDARVMFSLEFVSASDAG
jgi:hypothetical protein